MSEDVMKAIQLLVIWQNLRKITDGGGGGIITDDIF